MSTLRGTSRHYWVAIRAMLLFTLLLGVLYPLVITAVGQVAAPAAANGSLVRIDGVVVGSSLIGQGFTDPDGAARPEWFQSRPSAAGDGWNAAASSGSNLGPDNADLVKAVGDRQRAVEAMDGVSAGGIPADAVTASGSGLDPHISPAYARLQVDRVAAARGLAPAEVSRLVESMIQGRDLGFLGEPTVNVLQLNIALAEMGSGN